MRECKDCGELKEQEAFSPSQWTIASHLFPLCKKCRQDRIKRKRPDKPGHIYVITNPAWPDWCKVGMTSQKDLSNRLAQYQTNSPFRDYELYFTAPIVDVFRVEENIHCKLKELGVACTSEWFHIEAVKASNIITEYLES